MSVQFSNYVPDQVKDSQARQHCEKVETKAPQLLGIITQTASTAIDVSVAQKFFKQFNTIAGQVRDLQACLFNKAERDWLAGEVKSMLTYLGEVQEVCKQKLGETEKTRNQLDREAQRLEEKRYERPALADSKPISVRRAAKLDEEALTALSSTLSSLHTTKTELKGLEQEAKEAFAQLEAWKRAVEKGEFVEGMPPFNALREQVDALAIEELTLPEGLLAKVSYCSRVAGRALKEVAAIGAQLNSQLTEVREGLLLQFEAHACDHTLYQAWSETGRLPESSDFIERLQPEVSTRAKLEAVRWLNTQKIDELEAQIATIMDEKTQLEAQIASAPAQANLEALEKTLKEQEKSIALLSAEKSELQKRVEEAPSQTELDSERNRAEALSKHVEELQKHINELTPQNSSLSKEVEGLKKSVVDLRQQLDDAPSQEALKEQSDRADRLSEQVEKLQADLSAAPPQTELDSERNRAEALSKQVEELQKHINELRPQNSGLSGEVEGLKKSVADLQKQLDDAPSQETLKEQSDRADGLSGQVEKLQADLSAAPSQTELDSERNRAEALSKQVEELQKHINELRPQNSGLSEEVEGLKKSVADLQKQLDDAPSQEALREQSDRADGLSGQVEELQAKLQQRERVDDLSYYVARMKEGLDPERIKSIRDECIVYEATEHLKKMGEVLHNIDIPVLAKAALEAALEEHDPFYLTLYREYSKNLDWATYILNGFGEVGNVKIRKINWARDNLETIFKDKEVVRRAVKSYMDAALKQLEPIKGLELISHRIWEKDGSNPTAYGYGESKMRNCGVSLKQGTEHLLKVWHEIVS